jgi:hypothetical protein
MKKWLWRALGVLVILSVGCDNPTAPERLDSRTDPPDEALSADTLPGSDLRDSPSCDDPECAPDPRIEGTTVVVWFESGKLKGKASMRYFGNYGYVGIQVTATKDGNSVTSPLLFTELQRYALFDWDFIESPVAEVPAEGCGWVGSGLGFYRAETRSLFNGRTLRSFATQEGSAPAYAPACGCGSGKKTGGEAQLTGDVALSCSDGDSGGGAAGGYWRHICVTTIWGVYDPATGEYEIHGVETRCYSFFVNASIIADFASPDNVSWFPAASAPNAGRAITVVATGPDTRAPARAVWLARPGSQPMVVVDTTRATAEDLGRAIAAAEVLVAVQRQAPARDMEVSVSSIELTESWAASRRGFERMLTDLRVAPQLHVVGFGRVRALTVPLPQEGEIRPR